MSSNLDFNNPISWYDESEDREKLLFKEWLQGLLKDGEVNVTFFKADGTIREMRCTLESSLLPKVDFEPKEGATPRKRSDEALAVFDLDKNEWRSFRFDKIKEVRYTLGN